MRPLQSRLCRSTATIQRIIFPTFSEISSYLTSLLLIRLLLLFLYNQLRCFALLHSNDFFSRSFQLIIAIVLIRRKFGIIIINYIKMSRIILNKSAPANEIFHFISLIVYRE